MSDFDAVLLGMLALCMALGVFAHWCEGKTRRRDVAWRRERARRRAAAAKGEMTLPT